MFIFYQLQKWWDRNGWTFIFVGTVILLFLLWFFYSRHQSTGSADTSLSQVLQMWLGGRPVLSPYSPPPPSSSSIQSKTTKRSRGEQKCKEFLEYALGKPFDRIRPSFLTNPITQHPLELDLYNEELRLAVEYNGAQHYQYNALMFKNKDQYQNQKYRDFIKEDLCKKNNIQLIIVPYTVKDADIPEFLYRELKQRHFL